MKKTNHGKSAIIFASGLLIGLSALFVANAYTITTNIDNAVAYLKKMVFMNNTWNATGVIIDGNGSGYFAGNIGIGTTTPRGVVDIGSTGNIYLIKDTITGTTQTIFLPGHIYIAPYNGGNISYIQARRSNDSGDTALLFRTYSSGLNNDAIFINSSGNVGIGTTTPIAKLDVIGQIKITNGGDTGTAGSGCSNTGSIKYYDTHFYGCSGTGWLQLDN